jgi:hypothetical protein
MTVRFSAFAYRLLLFAFPADVRREFGDDMAAMFAKQVRDARRRRGGIVNLWVLAILREGTTQAVIGLAIGLTGGVLLMRTLQSMLFGVAPADPLTLSVVGAGLFATALAACVIPARKAMRVDPLTAVRA